MGAYTFSVDLFQWVDKNPCLIDFNLKVEDRRLRALSSSTFFDKNSTLFVVINCHINGDVTIFEGGNLHKLFRVEWRSQKVLEIEMNGHSGPLFALRNVVYMAHFGLKSCEEKDVNNYIECRRPIVEDIKVFAFNGNQFEWKQTISANELGSANSTELSGLHRIKAVSYYS